ncbi:MAG: DUF3303 family protein [Pyrinomonadaceae bacterium]
MLFMIIETFRNGDPRPVYERFAERGRLAPAGVEYISSWVNESLTKCFQIMNAESREQIDEWIANWEDIVSFEIVPVITSAEAAERVASLSR